MKPMKKRAAVQCAVHIHFAHDLQMTMQWTITNATQMQRIRTKRASFSLYSMH